jgi:hypothetical protein
VTDVFANLVVTQDGIYPMRLLWWEGTGGAGIEFFVVEQNYGARRLVNDRNIYFAVKAYRVVTALPPPLFTSVSANGGNVTINWTGAGTLQEASNLTGNSSDWSNVNPQPPGNTLTISAGSNPQKFYRIRQ